MLRGSITALVTPFDKSGRLDEKAFRAFVEWQIAEGTDGLVPVGTTGESPTLSHDEHRQVVEVCVEVAEGQGAGDCRRRLQQHEEAIDLVKYAEKVGADAVLVVTPYYNKPTPARPLRALRGGRQGDQPADHHLQHPAALGHRHDAGNDGSAGP